MASTGNGDDAAERAKEILRKKIAEDRAKTEEDDAIAAYDNKIQNDTVTPDLYAPDRFMLGKNMANAFNMSLTSLKNQCKETLDVVLPYYNDPESFPDMAFPGHIPTGDSNRNMAAYNYYLTQLKYNEIELSEYRARMVRDLLVFKWNFTTCSKAIHSMSFAIEHDIEVYGLNGRESSVNYSFASHMGDREKSYEKPVTELDTVDINPIIHEFAMSYSNHEHTQRTHGRSLPPDVSYITEVLARFDDRMVKADDIKPPVKKMRLGAPANIGDSDFGPNPVSGIRYEDAFEDGLGNRCELLVIIGTLKGRNPGLPIADTSENIHFFNNKLAPYTTAYWPELRIVRRDEITSETTIHTIRRQLYYAPYTPTVFPFHATRTDPEASEDPDCRKGKYKVQALAPYPIDVPFRPRQQGPTELDIVCEALRVRMDPTVRTEFKKINKDDPLANEPRPHTNNKIRVYFSKQHYSVGPWTVCWIYVRRQIFGVAVRTPVYLPFWARPGYAPRTPIARPPYRQFHAYSAYANAVPSYHPGHEATPVPDDEPVPFTKRANAMLVTRDAKDTKKGATAQNNKRKPKASGFENSSRKIMTVPKTKSELLPPKPRRLAVRAGASTHDPFAHMHQLAASVEEIKRALNDVHLLKSALVDP